MVYVLIPAHNNKQEVLAVLQCLSDQSYRDLKIILVDDGSTDGTYESVIEEFPDTVVLKGDGNLWWTGANVMGVDYILDKARDGDFVLLLNNDLEVDRDYIGYLVEASTRNGRAIIGSTLVDANKPTYLEAGIKLSPNLDITVNTNLADINGREIDLGVDVLPGRGTLIPLEVFKKVGNFNKRKLPHYGADYELAVRARRAGFTLAVSHKARVFAKLDVTGLESPDKPIISLRECFNLLFSKKSKNNIYYYLHYIWLCSEKKYRLRNTIYGVLHVMSITVFKTIPMYPINIFVLQPLLSITRFLFRSYPLRAADIEMYGLNPAELVKCGIIISYQPGGIKYYKFAPGGSFDIGLAYLSQADLAKVRKLKQLSMSYVHKANILWTNFKSHG